MIDKGFFKLNKVLKAVFSLKNANKSMIELMKSKLEQVCKFSILKSLLVGSISYKIKAYKVKNPLYQSGFIVENNKAITGYFHSKDFFERKIIANSLI